MKTEHRAANSNRKSSSHKIAFFVSHRSFTCSYEQNKINQTNFFYIPTLTKIV